MTKSYNIRSKGQIEGVSQRSIPTLIEPTKRQIKELRNWWIQLRMNGFEPRWFITLTIAPQNQPSVPDFLVELEQWLARLKTQPGIKQEVKACSEHIAALVAVGVPDLHNCGGLHAHAILFSDQDLLRWRHLARTNQWALGSITKFDKWDERMGTGAFDYLTGHHAILPHRLHCPRANKCRRKGCEHKHLNLPDQWFAGRLHQNSHETLRSKDDQPTIEPTRSATAYLYQIKTGQVRPTQTNSPQRGRVIRRTKQRRNTNETNQSQTR